jgi:S1-C subfamily serine protease
MMIRALTVAALVAVLVGAAQGQEPGVLHITITLSDAARPSVPVPRHALLISDNPATSSPRRILTGPDGTAVVRLPAGNYTVESDEPVAFDGRGYQWAQNVDIVAGRDAVLTFTAANAEVGGAPAVPASAPGATQDDDPLLLLPRWKDSVVAVWSPESRASGFVVDAAGLVLTNHHVVGSAPVVEVQFTPVPKVSARVIANDEKRDLAVLWIDPAVIASIPPVPLDCASGSTPSFAAGQKVVAIGAPFHAQTDISIGEVTRIDPQAEADFGFASGAMGGPVFSTGGTLVGLTSIVDDDNQRRRDARIVPSGDVCEVVGSAKQALQPAQRPAATHLPV